MADSPEQREIPMGGEPGADTHDGVYLVKRSAYEIMRMVPKTSPTLPCAAREWADPAQAPGGEVSRLRAVRVRNEQGEITECIDIRRPVQVEMEYEVIRPGYVLLPYYDLYNEESVLVFSTADLDPAWRRRPRPTGRYVSTVWIPGNLLSEGMLFVSAVLDIMNPHVHQFKERDVVAFQVIDSLDGDSARGDVVGEWAGAVRPLLQWSTQFCPGEDNAAPLGEAKVRREHQE
jgi:lipopolysaccharide transport system ATP-binding protein